jgi:methyl-accepting chemotaxis protein
MSNKSLEMRSKLLVNPRFQLRFILFSTLSAVMTAAVYYFATRYFFHYFIDKGKELGLAADHTYFGFMQQEMLEMRNLFLASFALILVLQVVIGLIYSHRIAGPIFRIQKYLGSWSKANAAEKLEIRSKDDFQELASVINEFINKNVK